MATESRSMNDTELGVFVRRGLEQSQGFDADELADNREQAMNYYLGREPVQNDEGSSNVVSTDVADMVEAVLANIVPSISGDSSVTFDAESDEDETQADMESDAVNIMIHDRNDGFIVFLEAIKDALLMKTGIVKVFVDEREQVVTDSFKNLNDLEILTVLEPDETTKVELTSREPSDLGAGVDMTVRYTRTTKNLRIEAVPPENFSVFANWHKTNLTDCPFTAERHFLRRSELIEMGFDAAQVADLPQTQEWQSQGTARNIGRTQPPSEPGDASQERIEVHQCFVTVDRDGDGIEERLEVWIQGTGPADVLRVTAVDVTPYGLGSPFINPHRWLGFSLFDKLAQIQDTKTTALRQWLNNAGNANVGRTEAVVGQVNMDDLGDKRESGIVRVKAPGMIRDLPFTDIGGSMLSLLQYQDQMRSERGGASLDMQSGDAQLMGHSIGSQGVDRIFTSKEQLAGLMTKTLGETLIKTVYLLVHGMMRSESTGVMRFRKAGDWVETDPATWPARDRVTVKIGSSPSERAKRSANLEKIAAFQQQLMQAGKGGEMVDDAGIYGVIKDWARSQEIETPEQYFIDPSSQAAAQARKQKQEAAAAQAKAQQEQQDKMVALQMQLAQAQLQSEQIQTLWKLAQEYFGDVLSAEVEEMKTTAGAGGQLAGMQATGLAKSAELSSVGNG